MRPLPPNLRSPTILTPTLQMDELRRSADASARELGIVPLATDATQRDAVVAAAQESGFLERGMASPPRTVAPRRLGVSAVGRPTPERGNAGQRKRRQPPLVVLLSILIASLTLSVDRGRRGETHLHYVALWYDTTVNLQLLPLAEW